MCLEHLVVVRTKGLPGQTPILTWALIRTGRAEKDAASRSNSNNFGESREVVGGSKGGRRQWGDVLLCAGRVPQTGLLSRLSSVSTPQGQIVEAPICGSWKESELEWPSQPTWEKADTLPEQVISALGSHRTVGHNGAPCLSSGPREGQEPVPPAAGVKLREGPH